MKKKMSLQASVKIEPRYTAEELKAIDHIVESEKGKAKVVKPGKEFSHYIKKEHPQKDFKF